MAGRIVLYGATGYMGGLVAHAMVASGARPVLAGRSRDRLNAGAVPERRPVVSSKASPGGGNPRLCASMTIGFTTHFSNG
jgi:hypothetical protein